MSHAPVIGRSRRPGGFAWFCNVLFTVVLGAVPVAARADTITLRFTGTADLTAFGGDPASVFAGSVTWDPNTGWVPVWPGCPDFCLDGSPGAVTATFAIDSIDYTAQIDPASRFIVWGFGGISLDVLFTPAIDLDGGLAADIGAVSLNMFSDPPDYSLLVDGQLPYDLTFLPHLNDRSLVFSAVYMSCDEACARATTLSVTPEPSPNALLGVGLLVCAWSARRRRHRVSVRFARNHRGITA